MPFDRIVDDEEEAKDDKETATSSEGSKRRFNEFDCTECNANNPFDDGFGDGDELICNYCGQEFKVKVYEDGRLKLKLN